ncbi:hypothetical protein [Ornithinimicrobium pekingense]|uniref:Polysaccharide chain length determinant N-terminal domain-containing protein n=1 Tax=Ornithinimicrobium pekingense TaxID=384677 RepID=A0ABQ2FBF6_9MICO|nr:hypothetical protein [Ornithinimicrobium pekingense]GGK71260.1 hypothetical protein GCM10011509_19680 [Ornithinimicrobium pekingense]
MDPRDILASLRRAWYVLLVGLLAAAGATYYVMTQTGPEFEAQASVVLVPGEAVIPENSNPFLYLGGGTALRDVLVRVLASDEIGDPLLTGRADGTTYEIGPDPTTAGPILVASTSSTTESEALGTLQGLLDLIPTTLEDVQASRDVPADARFTSLILAQDQEASVNRSGMIRMLVVVLGAIGVLTLFVAAWLDGRRGRAEPRHGVPDNPSQTHSPGPVTETPPTTPRPQNSPDEPEPQVAPPAASTADDGPAGTSSSPGARSGTRV